jgi:nudix-type nucleoside diphosphatase (YffH/AdpP family)
MAIELMGTETAYQGWGRYLIATIRLPNGAVIRREIEDHGVAAAVLPYDAERRTAVLVRQFRAPVFLAERRDEMLEVIAGTVEDPDPETCARREAMEEAGLRLGALEHVVTGWSMPGVSTERAALYLAPYGPADRTAAGGGVDEDEQITVVEMPLGELARMADEGTLIDFKTLILVQALRLRRPELFAG